jgi:hypothetical protein
MLILRCLHFSNNMDDGGNPTRLFKIQSILDHFNTVIAKVFKPFVNLCIDESLILWKGRLIFRQYIPSKRARFGVELFSIFDCETGFCLGLIVYTGKDTQLFFTEHGLPTNIVMSLMKPYLGHGHNLFIDNWYTSPELLSLLLEKNTNACGTVRKNRKGLPNNKKLKTGEMNISYSDKFTYVHWLDRRGVRMLSSIHTDVEMKATGRVNRNTMQPEVKPSCVLE